jgi:hypothetical protein
MARTRNLSIAHARVLYLRYWLGVYLRFRSRARDVDLFNSMMAGIVFDLGGMAGVW